MRRGHRNPGIAYSKGIDALTKAERKLRMAFRAWDRAQRAVANAERRLNAEESAGMLVKVCGREGRAADG